MAMMKKIPTTDEAMSKPMKLALAIAPLRKNDIGMSGALDLISIMTKEASRKIARKSGNIAPKNEKLKLPTFVRA